MLKFSELKNFGVFTQNKFSGYIQDVIFDKINLKVTGFVIKKSILNYSYLELENLEKQDFENLYFSKETNKEIFENYEIIGKKAVDLFGNKLGTVEDIEFYSNSGKLSAIYINVGINFYTINKFKGKSFSKNYVKIQAKNILEMEKDKIIIKNNNSIKESKKILENINKIFINVGVAIKKIKS
ncbi:MAG: PRC-barrel domain-containing protein [Candidatus Gracilibacteria bacterium]|nr:PRC-barrel domain-containing protein [Candidatus Gracilibacteria bacterium]